ncbi:MAG TPA: LuxR C-terminal-related transcriptional regulator [Thermoleophilaceae bacterium]|nr:LuxR C-terminal-related transcriptional regulator [Thermoleophilaceae bacterium]
MPRERLMEALAATPVKLALLGAPAGSGKTTLLTEWHAAPQEKRPFAWVSLDPSDNDPVRFYEYVIAALRTVDPEIGGEALPALSAPTPVTVVALPSLINDLAASGRPVVLVLDDYHAITNEAVHESIGYLLEHLPATVQLALASRHDPPLPLGRLRARGELIEIRAADLCFTDEEAGALLGRTFGLDLDRDDVVRLCDRTEGWAAGLQLAALSLRNHDDAHAFIASFAGDDRQIVDYLGAEVLDGQPEEVRRFLSRTSILERLCGSLCDAVTGEVGSADRLEALERANLFLLPLDAKREWYRYHQLFAELLRRELEHAEPELVTTLHRRAYAWCRERGLVSQAIRHATAAGDVDEASELITLHWYDLLQRGRIETVAGWLAALGDEAVLGDASLCLTKAWIAVNTGRLDEVNLWIEAGERAIPTADADGTAVLHAGVASLREIHRYMSGDVGSAVEAGRRSVAGGQTPWRPIGCPVLGIALFWSGQPDEAAAELERSIQEATLAGNHLASIHASGGLAAIHAEDGDMERADAVARRALDLARDRGLTDHWATTMARVVRGRALEQHGRLEDAGSAVERGLDLSQRGVAAVEIAFALLSRAETLQLLGDSSAARSTLRAARAAVADCPDPGILEAMLARAERRLGAAARDRAVQRETSIEELTERELVVLRLLPGELSQREIGEALFVSRNTVKTHMRGIFRKLGVGTRDEAVLRAREHGLL